MRNAPKNGTGVIKNHVSSSGKEASLAQYKTEVDRRSARLHVAHTLRCVVLHRSWIGRHVPMIRVGVNQGAQSTALPTQVGRLYRGLGGVGFGTPVVS